MLTWIEFCHVAGCMRDNGTLRLKCNRSGFPLFVCIMSIRGSNRQGNPPGSALECFGGRLLAKSNTLTILSQPPHGKSRCTGAPYQAAPYPAHARIQPAPPQFVCIMSIRGSNRQGSSQRWRWRLFSCQSSSSLVNWRICCSSRVM